MKVCLAVRLGIAIAATFAAGAAFAFDDAPIAVLFAVLPTSLVAEKHDGRLSKPAAVSQEARSAPHAVFAVFGR